MAQGTGAGQGPPGPPGPQAPGPAPGGGPQPGPDWAGLRQDLLVKVAGKLVAQTEAAEVAQLKELGWPEEVIQFQMAKRRRDGNCCLFVFALVSKEWRKAQLKVGGPLRFRVVSDVILPGSVELAKWALAEGCPHHGYGYTMAAVAAKYGHEELVRWLIQEQGFAMDTRVMANAAESGNLELVKWLRGEGCPWDWHTCCSAVSYRHVEVLRWARENGCWWDTESRDWADALGYTDDFGNVIDY